MNEQEEKDLEIMLALLEPKAGAEIIGEIRRLLPEQPKLKRLLLSVLDMRRAVVLHANGMITKEAALAMGERAKEAMKLYAEDASMPPADRAHVDQLLAHVRDLRPSDEQGSS